MYGLIGSAVLVELYPFFIKKFNINTIYGEKIEFHDKIFNKGQIFGGLIFGLGAMTELVLALYLRKSGRCDSNDCNAFICNCRNLDIYFREN
jgi:hypothetical protein